jgi:hypothetical protein
MFLPLVEHEDIKYLFFSRAHSIKQTDPQLEQLGLSYYSTEIPEKLEFFSRNGMLDKTFQSPTASAPKQQQQQANIQTKKKKNTSDKSLKH